MGKPWTQEEETYLAESWGHVTVAGIAAHLGRTENAVIVRVNRLGLPPYFESGDYVTLNALFNALYGRNVNTYHLKSWVNDRGLPIHNKKRRKCSARVVYLDEFWEWAEKNRSFLDFSKMEPLALGKEPAWVEEQRHKDFKSNAIQRKDPWTPDEDSRLKALLKLHRYGYAELSEILNRSEGAIQRRCNDLGLKERPVKADNAGEGAAWTDAMIQILADGIRIGDSYQILARKIGKSEKAVRGKVYNMYLTENADKVRALMGDGGWGANAPTPNVKQGVYLCSCRQGVKKDLSLLVGILRYRMNALGYDAFWQKDMCLNWNPMEGCAAGCQNCDECTEFRRIPPQYCVRCGATFYERATHKCCERCRIARKKQAQRHWARAEGRRKNEDETTAAAAGTGS